MKYQIIVDSGCDLKKEYLIDDEISFSIVPLTIHVGEQEFVDNENLDVNVMLKAMHSYNGKSSSACPAPQDFLDCFARADNNFVITITSALSGTYNSALTASKEISGKKKVHVIDSLSTCGSEILIIDKLVELIKSGESFENIVTKIEKYRDDCKLIFVLQKFDNLIANGRMSKVTAIIANVLSIKLICEASSEGEIQVAEKTIGSMNALRKMVKRIGKYGSDFAERKCCISHCFAAQDAAFVKKLIEDSYNFKEIQVVQMNGLASFYALEKGIIVCF